MGTIRVKVRLRTVRSPLSQRTRGRRKGRPGNAVLCFTMVSRPNMKSVTFIPTIHRKSLVRDALHGHEVIVLNFFC